jgi:prepilin-type processing-associated H-X9-DG protein
MYLNDHAVFPPDLAALQPNYLPDGRLLVCPVSGKPYVYSREVAGKGPKDIANWAATVLVHDAADAHPDGGYAAYADGHVKWLDREAFLKAVGGPPPLAPVRPP